VGFLEHFGLVEQPFGVTPDPRFMHLGPTHREALASLIYSTETDRGFAMLTGPPGTGKTSLLYRYMESLGDSFRKAFLYQTPGTSVDLMRYLLASLSIDCSDKDLPQMHELLSRFLMAETRAGRRLVLVVDEAQNLSNEVLETIRQLSNIETPCAKMMQIVLAGQPQFAERLCGDTMAQLRQRISTVISIEPFTEQETNVYINHRLWVAGHIGQALLTAGAMSLIAKESCGISRIINNLCFQSMTLAYGMNKKEVDGSIVRQVISELAIEKITAKHVPLSDKGQKSTPETTGPRLLMGGASVRNSRKLALGACAMLLLAVSFALRRTPLRLGP